MVLVHIQISVSTNLWSECQDAQSGVHTKFNLFPLLLSRIVNSLVDILLIVDIQSQILGTLFAGSETSAKNIARP